MSFTPHNVVTQCGLRSHFGHNSFFSQKISKNENMTRVIKLLQTNDRNVSVKRTTQHLPRCKFNRKCQGYTHAPNQSCC